MTNFDRPVTRRTVGSYRFTISGAMPCPTGRRLVATLRGDERGDWLEIREAGRQRRITLEIAGLYRRGLLAEAARAKTERRKVGK